MKKRRKKDGALKPSAVVLSILIHAGLFLLAGMLVVFTVVKKQEQQFDPPKTVERPKMKLKKPRVKVKKSSRPKSAARITSTTKRSSMPVINLPDLGGIGDGLGDGLGGDGGFGIMPDLGEISVFGGGQSIGNDFEGQVYSLLHNRTGGTAPMGRDMFREILRKYVLSGWQESILAPYYRSPKKLYTTHFMVPPIPTAMAPGVFGAPDLEDYYLFVKYEGQLVYPEDIKFRFWGIGDAYIFVHVGGKEVLLCTWQTHQPYFDWWQSSAGGDRTYIMGSFRAVVGDWIELKAGESLDMKVLYGEWHGGVVAGMLAVEVEGEEYPSSRTGGPLLPAFKTQEFSWDTMTEISRFLAEGECSLTNGPVFNDYSVVSAPPREVAAGTNASQVEAAAMEADEPLPREWTMADGRILEAEFVTVGGGKAVMKNARGKQIRIPMHHLSEADRSRIRLSFPPDLDINFKKTSRQRKFSATHNARALPVRGAFYTFATEIKKTSLKPYPFDLTVEYFAVGGEIGGNLHVLLDYRKSHCRLSRENDFAFEFSGEPVELLDYVVNSQRRGKDYASYLVVVTDTRGKIIAYQTPREHLYRNLENLRNIKVGWYFDDDCIRSLPTPPMPWAVGNKN